MRELNSGAGISDAQVLVLGGGISGCIAACLLADLGYEPVIVEQREHLMDAASRWNDGKIHLGYTYVGTDSTATAALMQQGTASFTPILEKVIGGPVPESWFSAPTIYLVDPASVFDVDTLWRRASAVADLLTESLAGHPSLARFGARPRRMDVELAQIETGQDSIVGAWWTPERHISTARVARAVRAAVVGREIAVVPARVEAVSRAAGGEGWRIALSDGTTLATPVVINALWESRALIDRAVAHEVAGAHTSIRYRVGLFGSATGLQNLTPSTRILGKFGDLIVFANGDAHLSWYTAGLSARSDDGVPPAPPTIDREAVIKQTLGGLGLAAGTLEVPGSSWEVNGGYVVALGGGDIDQRLSPLHARDHIGVNELRPGFISVDTGKYTTGPLFAVRAASVAERRLSEIGYRTASLAASA